MSPRTDSDEVPHPIDDVAQDFLPGDSHDVRDALVGYIRRDLLGPWDGEDETLPHRSAGPRDRYLVGLLGPRESAVTDEDVARAAAHTADVEPGSDQGDDGELPDILTPQAAGRIWASSMGMAFVVPAAVGTLTVTAAWGRYTQSDALADDGRTQRVWSREPVSKDADIVLTRLGDQSRILEGDAASGIHLDVQVRERPAGPDGEDLRVVEVALVNRLGDSRELRDAHWLFQSSLTVVAFPHGDAAVFRPVDDPLAPGNTVTPEDAEERRLRLLYRHNLRHAVGRNVAVHADVRPGERSAYRLTTMWLPEYDVPATTAPSVEQQPLLAGLELGMDALAELAVPERRAELRAALAPLADGYYTWLQEQRAQAAGLPEDLRVTALTAIDQAEDVCHRITFGIDLLATDEDALQSFRFANRAMALQRRNTAIASLRAGNEDDAASYSEAYEAVHARGPAAATWRPFQLAFVLLNLASLTDPAHPHRDTGEEAVVDLLFFPTGGGKTEAYLGLAAYTFALRRLQGVVGSGAEARSGLDGVAVLMRYTLRLLTAQQFQRAAALVTAAEMLRREDPARWGGTPFRIGLWVGTSVSPNWGGEAQQQIAGAKESANDKHARVLQVLSCPWCGQGLTAFRNMEYDEVSRRVLLYCARGEGEGRCPFSRMAAHGEGIPAMVIATVDKFAQLPWNGYAGLLFGRVTTRCPRHGYRHPDLDEHTDCRDRHNAKGGYAAVTAQPVVALRPPDLIIQDELHLISGALGTTVGLFEGAVDLLCSWTYVDADGNRHEAGPKIVASTATTKRAGEQVRGVFGRKVATFPPQVLDVTDTFFSRQVPLTKATPGRRYLGVCAHGTRLKAAEIRVAEILLLAPQQLFDVHGAPADPYMTLVGYFNATRELAGMRRYMDDDIAVRVRKNGHRRGHEKIADRIVTRTGMLTVQELTSRISSADIGATLKRLESGFDPERDTSIRRRALNAEYAAAKRDKREPRAFPTAPEKRAVDVVLATSMLQVGVDVSRFGLMMVVGQPKNTAEYIQASSRVGRDATRPGLVVTLYNWSRPRDLTHFEDFESYHATFYRQVEALSVTPYTRRALDRGVAPLYIAALRQATFDHSRNTDAHGVELDGPVAERVRERLLTRADRIGGSSARAYLKERIDALTNAWEEARLRGGMLGYRREQRKNVVVSGLLRKADGARWDILTVPMSMRETENEINLLVGGGSLTDSATHGGPEWRFGPPADPDGTPAGGDEFGEDTSKTRKEN
jgi:hypothetical protein